VSEELNALEMMGISIEEGIEADKAMMDKTTNKRQRNPEICLCGHSSTKHSNYAGLVNCKPAALGCPCKKLRVVLEAEDTRLFLRKTGGGGAMHALSRGITSSIQAGKAVKWKVELVCDRCQSGSRGIVPVPVTQSGYGADYATGFDALLCPDCRQAV
jgi:hypothetical protein